MIITLIKNVLKEMSDDSLYEGTILSNPDVRRDIAYDVEKAILIKYKLTPRNDQ